ncbi:hypothetical protein [Streptomyces sp. NPDC051572]|uniref:hypothetical protein n=1 Tax=Streptomyces sp. NPDC051572 TaxID=3155802 RepID=UPI00344E6AFC
MPIRLRVTIRYAAVAAALLAVPSLSPTTASATPRHPAAVTPNLIVGTGLFYDRATGRCLDSNAAGKVYTTARSSCGGNNHFQESNAQDLWISPRVGARRAYLPE